MAASWGGHGGGQLRKKGQPLTRDHLVLNTAPGLQTAGEGREGLFLQRRANLADIGSTPRQWALHLCDVKVGPKASGRACSSRVSG